MGQTVTVRATDPTYAAMVAAATEALRAENLRIVVRGANNKKDGILPIERYGLNFYIAGSMGDATVFKGSYTAEDLKVAVRNTEKAAVIGTMCEVLEDGGSSVDDWEPDGSADTLTVLSARGSFNGAGVLFCDSVLHKIWEKVGDFYILPSSIHEVLIVPVSDGIDRSELETMVRTVNEVEVAAEDQLADKVFLFDGILH